MLAFRMKAWLPPPATKLQVNVGIIIADKRNAVKLTAHVNNQGNMPIQIKYYNKNWLQQHWKKKRNFTDDNNYDDIEENWETPWLIKCKKNYQLRIINGPLFPWVDNLLRNTKLDTDELTLSVDKVFHCFIIFFPYN